MRPLPATQSRFSAPHLFAIALAATWAAAAGCSSGPRLPAASGPAPAPVPSSDFVVDQPALKLLGAEHGILLVGYDIEWWREAEEPLTGQFLARMAEIHRELAIPATLFPVGLGLEFKPGPYESFRGDPLFEIAQHTLEHLRLKSLVQVNEKGTTFLTGASLDEIEASLARANAIIRARVGVSPAGLTAPYGYYRGLSDRPDILAILAREGLHYVRSWARDEHDWQPVPLDVQPFWYAAEGFPDILEIPIQGWQDSLWREENGWERKDDYLALVRAEIDEVASRNLVFSYDQHDWSSLRDDPQMEMTRAILVHAKQRGMAFATHEAFHRAAFEARERNAVARGAR